MSVDEEAFLRLIASEDSDDARLVYADWLEERGDARAEYLRLEVTLHRAGPGESPARRRLAELAGKIDPAWRRRVDRAPSGEGQEALPVPRAELPSVSSAHVPSWTRVRDEPLERDVAAGSVVDRLRSVSRGVVVIGALLLVLAVGSSGCLFVTHLTCRGGQGGTCSVDSYGLFTTVGHVDVPAREIVEVSVDERTSRRWPDAARVTIVTRSMGKIDLAGGQLLDTSGFATSDAVRAAAALRHLDARGDVDLWIGPPRATALATLASAVLWWSFLAKLVAGVLRPDVTGSRRESPRRASERTG